MTTLPRRKGFRIDTDAQALAEQAAIPLSKATAELLAMLPKGAELDRIVGEPLAAEYLSLSYSYIRELRDQGVGPDWIRLSNTRIGYRVRDLMAWCEARKRKGGVRSRSLAASSNG